MATVAVTSRWAPESGQEHIVGVVTMSNSYATGGEAIAIPGVERIAQLIPSSAAGRTFRFDPATQKLLAHSAAATEVVPAVDLSGTPVPFHAVGF
jgi:hypothetical protein